MQPTILLIAVLYVRWFGTPTWLQIDGWVKPWLTMFKRTKLWGHQWLFHLIVLAIPLGICFFALKWAEGQGGVPYFLFTAVILFYCIGRDGFREPITAFIASVNTGDLQESMRLAKELGVPTVSEERPLLYRDVLLASSYRAMERLFVVFFWFVIAGPIGALLYRLVRLYFSASKSEQDPDVKEGRALITLSWLLEWPVVRLLGLSFAITGNFMSCMQRWRHSLLCFKTPSDQVLGNAVGGALDIDVDCIFDCELICAELEALMALFYRTSLFWLCGLAVYVLIGL